MDLTLENRSYAEVCEEGRNYNWRKFGMHDGYAGFLYETVWGATPAANVSYLAAADAATIESTSANDVLGGSGAEKVFVRYLSLAAGPIMTVKEVIKNLAGLTPVTIATDVYRILKVSVTQSANGANTATNAGTLLVKNSGATLTLARVPIGTNHDQGCFVTVPTGYKCVVKAQSTSPGATSGGFQFWSREYGKPWQLEGQGGSWASNRMPLNYPMYRVFPEHTDLELKGNGGGDNWHGITFVMLPND